MISNKFGTARLFRSSLLILMAGAMLWFGLPSPAQDKAGKIPFPIPNSHKAGWTEYHGATVDLNAGMAGWTGTVCLTCHERSDCSSCHNTRPPRDHTNFWRTRGHGLMASGDRDRCITCHKQDYCVRCHNETAPRTHVGNWRQRHCTSCHYASFPVPADGCGVCHRRAVHTSGTVP